MAQVSVDRALQIAAESQRAGRFAEAENLYRQILVQIPNHVPVLQNLGVVIAQQRRTDEAYQLFSRILELEPNSPGAHSDLGNVLRDLGRLDEAIASYRKALSIQPDFAIAYSNLGNALRDAKRPAEAVEAYQQSIRLNPNFAETHSNLGNALSDLGRLDEAISAYRRAIQILPAFPAAQSNLGAALQRSGRAEEAVAAFQRAIELAPDYAEAHNNLGHCLELSGRLDEAMNEYVRAIQLKPNLAGAYCNLGNVLLAKKRIDDAIAALRTAIRLEPDMPEGHSNLGNALSDKGYIDEALAEYRLALKLKPQYADALSNMASALIERGSFDEPEKLLRQAIECEPNFPDAHWNLALFLLLHGDFAHGWPEYEWRWKVRGMVPPPRLSQPQWDGQPIDGKTILLHTEQGYGDAIQFIRYASLVKSRGANVILKCPPDLKRLFGTVEGIDLIQTPDEPSPPFDVHCPLLSLPQIFKTDLNSIPASPMPYLRPDPTDVEAWRTRLESEKKRRIGLVWAGDPAPERDASRSIVLCNFAPLAEIKDATIYSLQKGEGARHISPTDVSLVDFTPDLKDFADTAAFIANLDLVIAVDTSVAHVAAAIGKPVWLLLPFSPDWRWLLNRPDSPWYPTMRLFRQKTYGDWTEVIQRVAIGLKEMPR